MKLPAHERRTNPWRQATRGGTKADRTLSEVTVWLPPHIAELDVALTSSEASLMEGAVREVAALDEAHGHHLASLSVLLLRAESVASSKIEHIEASLDDYARALHGIKANIPATSMVASTRALDDLIRSVDGGEAITLENVLGAHSVLMADDPHERAYAGRLRDMQNWIGGSDHSPRNALYVPPPAGTVPAYVDDLIAFANRSDVPTLAQAALAHAQFESIHPFTDGNGRIGRALINTILRGRAVTRRVVVPLASAIVANRESYFGALNDYRLGDATPILTSFAHGAATAAEEAQTSAGRLAEMPQAWLDAVGGVRRGSAAQRLIDSLSEHPVFSAEDAERRVGGSTSSVYAAINRLYEAEVIRPLTKRTRNQVWVAASIADELDDLGGRIAARVRE